MSETTNNVVEMATEKKYTLRKLEAKDIAPMASILSKIGLKEVKNCFSPDDMKAIAGGDGSIEAVGAVGVSVAFEIAGVILSNYERCQNDVFSFLASLSGMDIKQIESLPLGTFTEMVIDVVKKEEFKDFMKVVSKLFKSVTSNFGICCIKDTAIP